MYLLRLITRKSLLLSGVELSENREISKIGLKEVEKKSYHEPSTTSQAPLLKSMMVKIPACVTYEVRK